MKNIIHIIKTEWSFIIPNPKNIIDINPFGNVIVEDYNCNIWRIIPEDLSAFNIGNGIQSVDQYFANKDNLVDWEMENLAQQAKINIGPISDGECYGFKIHPVLGGKYELENISIFKLDEWIGISGNIANQIKDLPDSSEIEINITN